MIYVVSMILLYIRFLWFFPLCARVYHILMSKRRKSIGVTKAAAESPRPTNAPDPLSESEISALFEQCIKITTENVL